MPDAFYLPLGEGRYAATSHCVGPWDARFQHGGPPSALLAREVERTAPREDMLVARVTVEILGPVPVSELAVRARVSRPGRSVELLEGVLDGGGREVARVSAWRVRRTEVSAGTPEPPPPLPAADSPLHTSDWVDGYLSAVQWRLVSGDFGRPGRATAWTRLRYPLVAGEEPTGLQRVMAVADSGNGLSSELELGRWQFINPELTVHLHREPAGEWVCLDARTVISAGGVGLASSVLGDGEGWVGTGAQSLLVAPR